MATNTSSLFKTMSIIVGAPVLVVGLIVASYIVWGLVLSFAWAWLIVPVFPMAPAITIAQAIGLGLVAGIFLYSVKKEESYSGGDTEKLVAHLETELITWPAAVLLVAWIVSQFI